MKTSSLRSASAFTLVEVLVALAIGALLAAFLIPQLMKTNESAQDAAAENLRAQIQGVYDQWASIGGSNTTSASPDLTMALLNLLSSTPDSTISSTPNYVAVLGDPQAIREQKRMAPLPGTIRTRLSSAPVQETINGTPSITYAGKFIVSFTPTTSNQGTWTVSRIP